MRAIVTWILMIIGREVAALSVYELVQQVAELRYLVVGGLRVGKEGVKPKPDDGDFMGEVFDLDDLVELLDSIGGQKLGVEAVLAGVLIAEGSAALFLGRLSLMSDRDSMIVSRGTS